MGFAGTRHRCGVIGLGALVLISAACGSGGGSADTRTTPPTTTSISMGGPAPTNSPTVTDAEITSPTTIDAAERAAAWVNHDPTSTLPPLMRKWNIIDRANWSTCRRGTDQSADKAIVVAGDRIDIPGYPERPTLIQLAKDPAAPMIVVFHAFGGCIANMQKRTDLDAVANERGVSMLWLSGKPDPDRTWYPSMDKDATYRAHQKDDFEYIDAVFTALHDHGITPRRVVSVGVSLGAGMAITAACLRPNWFDGAISVAGWLPLGCQRAPLSVMAFSGGKDPEFGATYGRVITSNWRKNVVECPTPARTKNDGRVISQTWQGCTGGSIVRLVILPDAYHMWPKFTYYDIDEDILRMALGSFPDDLPK